MSGTQANLLFLTSRLHDVENSAQFIESQKIALALESDEIYETYCNALDARKIQVAFNDGAGARYFVDATFNNVCTYDANRVKQYSLADAKSGKLFVNSDTKKAYKKFETDKYSFAWEMLGLQGSSSDLWGNTDNQNASPFSQVEEAVLSLHLAQYDRTGAITNKNQANQNLTNAYNNYQELLKDENAKPDDILNALKEVKDILYTSYMGELYPLMRLDKDNGNAISEYISLLSSSESTDDILEQMSAKNLSGPDEFPVDEFKYYLNLWESIHNAGGCKEIPVDAEKGDEANKWFNSMVNTGRAIINVYNETKKEWGETSVGTSANTNFLQDNQDDTDLKKAEAEYEYQLSVIEQKDAKFDRELSKLETERTSIKKIMDTSNKVIDDNIEKTFNIFS